MLRHLVATRPLLSHMVFGGTVAAVWEAAELHQDRNAILEEGAKRQRGRTDNNKGRTHTHTHIPAAPSSSTQSEMDDVNEALEDWTAMVPLHLAVAAAVGGLQGAAMRYYYPLLESFVDTRIALRLGSQVGTAAKIAIDHLPAFSTVVLHFLSAAYYESVYGLPADPDSLRAVAEDAAVRLRAAMNEVQESWLKKQQEGATGPDKRDQAALEASAVAAAASIADAEQMETIDLILSTEPNLANLIALAGTVLNFTLVPRWLRGMVGVVQWQFWDWAQSDAYPEDDEGGGGIGDYDGEGEEGRGGGGGRGSSGDGGVRQMVHGSRWLRSFSTQHLLPQLR
jgi:hypothetical protein